MAIAEARPFDKPSGQRGGTATGLQPAECPEPLYSVKQKAEGVSTTIILIEDQC
jgi:hypothetical protein